MVNLSEMYILKFEDLSCLSECEDILAYILTYFMENKNDNPLCECKWMYVIINDFCLHWWWNESFYTFILTGL